MRISDWSSDVCSSDLARNGPRIKSGVTREEGRTEECYSTSQEKSRWSPAPIRALGRGSRSRSPKPEPISPPRVDRKSVVEGKSVSVRVDLGGRRIIKKKKHSKETSKERRKTNSK